MSKYTKFAAIGLLCLGAACSKVPAGNVGIKVHLFGAQKGLDHEELGTGRYWIGPNEELYVFPTFTQTYVWTQDPAEGSPNDESITFQTLNGLSVNADIGISYHIEADQVSTVFERYRKGIDEITDLYLRNIVRDAFMTVTSKHVITYVYGEGKAAIISEVEELVRKEVEPIGIVVENIYWASDLRLPETVAASLNDKVIATQRAAQRENEVAEARAEAQKREEEARGQAAAILRVAEAQAEANRLLGESLTEEVVMYHAIEAWNGELPAFVGAETPMLTMPTTEVLND